MENGNIRSMIKVEHHALIFGLLCHHANEQQGELGIKAVTHATKEYARERGYRMQKKAVELNMPLNLYSYNLLTQWYDVDNTAISSVISFSPNLYINVKNCPWYKIWRKYNFTFYGENLYCKHIDKEMLYAFNPQLSLELNYELNTWSDCYFKWIGMNFKSKELLEDFFIQKSEIKEYAVEDFLYHCGHLLDTFVRIMFRYMDGHDVDSIITCVTQDVLRLYDGDIAQAIITQAKNFKSL